MHHTTTMITGTLAAALATALATCAGGFISPDLAVIIINNQNAGRAGAT